MIFKCWYILHKDMLWESVREVIDEPFHIKSNTYFYAIRGENSQSSRHRLKWPVNQQRRDQKAAHQVNSLDSKEHCDKSGEDACCKDQEAKKS